MSGDVFVYGLIVMNAGACLFYLAEGAVVKAFYWLCVIGLNYCVLRMK